MREGQKAAAAAAAVAALPPGSSAAVTAAAEAAAVDMIDALRKADSAGGGERPRQQPRAASHILGQARPGGALGLPRGAGQGRGCARPALR